VLSADCNGSAAVRYGRCRDHLLGFRAVNGFGEAYKAGGKVVKNVTGFDLPKLFCGAMGTLGPLAEVTLRVFPKAQLSKTFAVRNLPPPEGLSLLLRIWSSPLEATGLGFHDDTAFIRVEGSRTALDEKIGLLRALSATEPQQTADGDETLSNIASGKLIADAEDALWRIHVPPASAEDLVSGLQPITWCADWAGALVWAVCDVGKPVRVIGQRFGARAICMRGGNHTLPYEPEDRVRAELTRRVKAAFDPLRLFNPGLMWEGV